MEKDFRTYLNNKFNNSRTASSYFNAVKKFEEVNNIDSVIENNILKIRNKYGKDSLKRAICINNFVKPSTPGFYK